MKGSRRAFAAVMVSALCAAACRSRTGAGTPTTVTPPTQARAAVDGAVSSSPVIDASVVERREDAAAPSAREAECVVVARSTQPIGRYAALTSVTAQAHGDAVVVAWTVPPQFAHGGDDLAAKRINLWRHPTNGTPEISAWVLDAEEPSTARGLARSPTNIYRVFSRAGATLHSLTTGTDQLSRDDNGNELIECGEFSVHCATVSDTGSDDAVARTIVRGAPYFARTAFNAARPFVLGLRTADVAEQPSPRGYFFTTRATEPSARRDLDFWPLDVDAALVRRSRNPAAALRDFVPEGLEVVEVEGRGYAVSFRYRGRLRFGWLDRDLRPVGALHEVVTLGGEPGRPRLASVGAAVLLVVADRERVDSGASRYKLYGTLASHGAAPGVMFRLPTGMDETQDEFAPAITATRDQRFALLWSYGPLEARARSDRQDIYVRSFDAALQPIGAALRVTEQSGSDPRAAPIGTGNDVLVVWGQGAGLQRPLVAAAVRCGPPLATDAGVR